MKRKTLKKKTLGSRDSFFLGVYFDANCKRIVLLICNEIDDCLKAISYANF
jgi:hypothetical protein